LINDKPIKLIVHGWITDDKTKSSNVPDRCPKCNSELWRTDALKICNMYIVGCKNVRDCRWCEVFQL